MPTPLVALTGFAPYEEFSRNPTGELVQRLARTPPEGMRVKSRVLPVSFLRAPRALDDFLTDLGEVPALILGLGQHRSRGFRIERIARARLLRPDRPDEDGMVAADAPQPRGPDRFTSVDLDGLVASLHARGVEDAYVSKEAGGYVCERTYHRLLVQASRSGAAGLFLHTPRPADTSLVRQEEVVRWVMEILL